MPEPRETIQKLRAYAPGEQPRPGGWPVVKLNTNECPEPPSPRALAALRAVDAEALRVYPPPLADAVRRDAADLHGLAPEQVIATNGGDELLRLVITAYCTPGSPRPAGTSARTGTQADGGIGVTTPSYSLYPVLAAIQDTPVCVVERDAGFELATDMAQRWNDAGCALAMIVNPHAPTGLLATNETLRAVAEAFDGLLLIDEAYTNFASHDALGLVRDGVENVLLLRSMSKGYGLAGLRLGFGLGPAPVIAALDKARDSYNTDIVAQRVASAALRDQDYARGVWQRVIASRGALTAALRQRGFAVLDSQANFVLATPPAAAGVDPVIDSGSNSGGTSGCTSGGTSGGGADKPDARALYAALKDRGILVRYFDQPRLDDKLRITVGTPEQNQALLEALDALM